MYKCLTKILSQLVIHGATYYIHKTDESTYMDHLDSFDELVEAMEDELWSELPRAWFLLLKVVPYVQAMVLVRVTEVFQDLPRHLNLLYRLLHLPLEDLKRLEESTTLVMENEMLSDNNSKFHIAQCRWSMIILRFLITQAIINCQMTNLTHLCAFLVRANASMRVPARNGAYMCMYALVMYSDMPEHKQVSTIHEQPAKH